MFSFTCISLISLTPAPSAPLSVQQTCKHVSKYSKNIYAFWEWVARFRNYLVSVCISLERLSAQNAPPAFPLLKMCYFLLKAQDSYLSSLLCLCGLGLNIPSTWPCLTLKIDLLRGNGKVGIGERRWWGENLAKYQWEGRRRAKPYKTNKLNTFKTTKFHLNNGMFVA